MTIAPPADLAPRTSSFDVDAFPMPTGREEEWRFAPMQALGPFLQPQHGVGSVRATGGSAFVENRPQGILDWWAPTNRPAAIARAQAANTVVVDIPADAQVAEAIVVSLQADAPHSAQHVEIRAGRFSTSTVVVAIDTAHDIAGAIVVDVPKPGYGRACLAAIAALPPVDVIVFVDGDAADDLTAHGWRVDYIEVRQADTLEVAHAGESRLVVLAAARLGRTRLIDNIEVTR